MHILLIVSWYKSKDNPVSGVFFEEQARALQKRGHTVGIIVPTFLNFSDKEKHKYYEYDDNGIYTVHQSVKAIIPRNHSFNYKHLAFRVYWKSYKDYVKRCGVPDLIHSHVYKHAGNVGIYIKSKTNIPLIYTEHFSMLIDPKANLHKSDIALARNVLLNSDKVITVSNFLKNEINKRLELKSSVDIEVVPNLINDKFINTEITDETSMGQNCLTQGNDYNLMRTPSDQNIKLYTDEKSSRFRFINIGNLVEIKQQILLIRAFNSFLKNTSIESELVIVGEGKLRDEIENEIIKLNLSDRVFLLGRLSREETLREVQKSNVGIISSKIETFSVAGIEFLSQGLPVVSTNCGGPNDFINDENGIIIDDSKLVKYLTKIFNDYKKYNLDYIKVDVVKRFSERVIINKLETIYRALIK